MKFEMNKPANFHVAQLLVDLNGVIPDYLSVPKVDIPEWAKRYVDYLDTSVTQEVCKCEWVAHPEDLAIRPLCCRECKHPREKHGVSGFCSDVIKWDDAIDGPHACECASYVPRRVRMGDMNEHCPVHSPIGRIMGFFEFVFGISDIIEGREGRERVDTNPEHHMMAHTTKAERERNDSETGEPKGLEVSSQELVLNLAADYTSRPRGICPVCKAERRVKDDGTMGSHRRVAANGYSLGQRCPGTDEQPDRLILPQ